MVPCYGPDRERLLLGERGMELLKFSIEREEPLAACPSYSWRDNSVDAQRFDSVGITTMHLIQESNGVFERLDARIPGWVANEEASFVQIRQLLKMQVLTRKRYGWDLACEARPESSSAAFYAALFEIRNFFFGKEEMFALYAGDAHSHPHVHTISAPDGPVDLHDDFHGGVHHLHRMNKAPIEIFKLRLFVFQFLVMFYFIGTIVGFFIFTTKKPQIENSYVLLKQQRNRFLLCQGSFFVLVTITRTITFTI